jgi:hypothetical protein
VRSLLVLILLFTSCSSSSKEKTWYVRDVAKAERKWEYCTKDRFPVALHDTGFCYSTELCYRTFFNNEKCKDKLLYCKHGDLACLAAEGYPEIRKRGN